MKRFVTLLRFTSQGAKTIKKSPARAAAFAKAAQRVGVRVELQLWTTGHYDGVVALAATNERKVFGALAALAAQGYVQTETLTAFDSAEFSSILRG